jgi:hypothetical protein
MTIKTGGAKMRISRCNYWCFLVLAASMLLMSCGGSGSSSPSASIQTNKWQLDGNGYVQFLTNDPQYYNYSFWNSYTQTNETQMTTVTATVKKQSGSLNGGYGIIFCYQDSDNYYRILIDADGHYNVVAKVAGVYSAIIPWTPSQHLKSGVGVENVIGVSQLGPNNFSVNFNGTQETLFNDGNFTGGRAGFSASVNVQAAENFPNTPEDLRFKLSSPLAYP